MSLFAMVFVQCRKEEQDMLPQKRLIEMVFALGGTEAVASYKFEYDEEGHVIKLYFNDNLFIERASKGEGTLQYAIHFPDELPILLDVIFSEDGIVNEISEVLLSTEYDGNLPSKINVTPSLFNGLNRGIWGSSPSYCYNFNYYQDSVSFNFLFSQMPYYPWTYDEEVVLSDVVWHFGNKKSPIPIPLQDIAFLGPWNNIVEGPFLKSLLYILNLSQISAYLPSEYLVVKKAYSGNTNYDAEFFEYDLDSQGYITRMYVKQGSTSTLWDTFEFTYSE